MIPLPFLSPECKVLSRRRSFHEGSEVLTVLLADASPNSGKVLTEEGICVQ